jgi:poly-gamma-glutamate synthesis protein (capsule biosynthesis protein)
MVNVVKFHHKEPAGKKGNVDFTLLKNQISFCKEQTCDIIIASLHWGYEYEFFPRQEQVDTAHDIIEAGADIIVSHHAHVIQPIEYYQTQRDPERTAIITYSLGNLTTSFSAPHLVLSAVLNLTIVKGSVNGGEKTYVQEAKLIPVVQTEATHGDLPIIQLEKLATFSARESKTKEEKDYITAVERYASLILGDNDKD